MEAVIDHSINLTPEYLTRINIKLTLTSEVREILQFPQNLPDELDYTLMDTERVLHENMDRNVFQEALRYFITSLDVPTHLEIIGIRIANGMNSVIHVARHNDFIEKINLFVRQYTNTSANYGPTENLVDGEMLGCTLNTIESSLDVYSEGQALDDYTVNEPDLTWTIISLNEVITIPISQVMSFIFDTLYVDQFIINSRTLWSSQEE